MTMITDHEAREEWKQKRRNENSPGYSYNYWNWPSQTLFLEVEKFNSLECFLFQKTTILRPKLWLDQQDGEPHLELRLIGHPIWGTGPEQCFGRRFTIGASNRTPVVQEFPDSTTLQAIVTRIDQILETRWRAVGEGNVTGAAHLFQLPKTVNR
jgi:hypothetical protein